MKRTFSQLPRSAQTPGRRHSKAQTTVEFSLILWPFLLLLLATCDYAQLYFYEASLRHSLREAGRFATTGKTEFAFDSNGDPILDGDGYPMATNGNYGGNGPMSRNEAIRRVFRRTCLIKAMDDGDIQIVSWHGTNNAPVTEANPDPGPGLAEHKFKITASWPIQLITPVASILEEDGVYVVSVTGIFRNEPSDNFNRYVLRHNDEP